MMIYRIGNPKDYLTSYLTVGAIITALLLVFTFVTVWLINIAVSKGSYLVYWLWAALDIFLAGIVAIVLMIIFNIKKGDYGVLWIEILNDGIAYKTPKHLHKIPYSYFANNNIQVHLGIFFKGYKWHTMSVLEFLRNAMKYVTSAIDAIKPEERKNMWIEINITNPNERMLKQVLFKFQIYLFGKGANMSLKTFENMLNEWREKYEAYLREGG